MSKQGNTKALTQRVLKSLSGDDALAVLVLLAEKSDEFAEAIDAVVRELMSDFDSVSIAAEVTEALVALEPEDVFERSGKTRYGYVEPSEAAWEIFDEVLEPFCDEIRKCRMLSLFQEADLRCQGVLKGVYDFDTESSSEFKEWAEDAPSEAFASVLKDWIEQSNRHSTLETMQKFIEEQCPEYAKFAIRMLQSENG